MSTQIYHLNSIQVHSIQLKVRFWVPRRAKTGSRGRQDGQDGSKTAPSRPLRGLKTVPRGLQKTGRRSAAGQNRVWIALPSHINLKSAQVLHTPIFTILCGPRATQNEVQNRVKIDPNGKSRGRSETASISIQLNSIQLNLI